MAAKGRLTRTVQGVFLDHLAGTCNVRRSAQATGVDHTSIYALRRRDARFAEEWQGALQAGYDVLETALVGLALDGDGEKPDAVEDGFGAVNVDLAKGLLTIHRNAMKGKPHKGGTPLKQVTSQETDRIIMQRLGALEKQRGYRA